MEAINCNFSDVVINNYKNNVRKMENVPDSGFEEASKGNFNFIGIRFHCINNHNVDDLLLLDPKISQDINDFDICVRILLELGKVTGKNYGSYQYVLIDSDYYQNRKIVFLQQHQSPHIWDNHQYSWQGETILCSPNDKLIQYAIQRVNEERERKNR